MNGRNNTVNTDQWAEISNAHVGFVVMTWCSGTCYRQHEGNRGIGINKFTPGAPVNIPGATQESKRFKYSDGDWNGVADEVTEYCGGVL